MSKRTITENTSLVLDYPSLTYEGNITFDGPVEFQHGVTSDAISCTTLSASSASFNSTTTTSVTASTIGCTHLNCDAVVDCVSLNADASLVTTMKGTSLTCSHMHLNNAPNGNPTSNRYSDIQSATITLGATTIIPNTYALKPGPALLKFGMVIADGTGNYGQYDQEYLCYTVGTSVTQTAGINQSKKEVGSATTGKISFTLNFTGAVGQLSVTSTSSVTFQALIWTSVTSGF
jgi:hypothetical protein